MQELVKTECQQGFLYGPIIKPPFKSFRVSPLGLKWDQKGVKNINDLVHDNGEFLSQDEFEHAFNIKTNFVQYLGLKWAIVSYAMTHSILTFSKKNYICHYCLQKYTS